MVDGRCMVVEWSELGGNGELREMFVSIDALLSVQLYHISRTKSAVCKSLRSVG